MKIRWMVRRDLFAVIDIERRCYLNPWSEDDFVGCLRQRNTIGMVIEDDDETVIGYMVYELHKHRLLVLNIAIDPDYQRQCHGSALICYLICKLSPDRRNRITVDVRDGNLPAQLFFQSLGFRAVAVLKDMYADCDDDAYLMVFTIARHLCRHEAKRLSEQLPPVSDPTAAERGLE